MLKTATLVTLGEWTNLSLTLPLLVFFPTSRCNSRCVSCDWWKASGEGDLTLDEIARIARALPGLGTRVVLFSGGEPLLRPEVFEIAGLFRQSGVTLHLHTSGVLLERTADRVASTFSRVIVSLDAHEESAYRSIRGVNALQTLERGVARLRERAPAVPTSARSTLHRRNFRALPGLIEHAKAMGVDSISFLAADVGSAAFGRTGSGSGHDLLLTREEIVEFADLVERTIVDHDDDFRSGFVAESPDRLRNLPRHYAALAGLGPFPPVRCNAPHVSVVIEADGTVRPCFFHRPVGSVRQEPLEHIVSRTLPAFRSQLRVSENPTCTRCVCALRTTWRSAPWL